MQINPMPPWLASFAKVDKYLTDNFLSIRAKALQGGLLDLKTKLIIAMLLDAYSNHPQGARYFAEEARKEGACDDELAEAIEVLYYIAGAQMLHGCLEVFGKP